MIAGHSFNFSDHCTLPRQDGTVCPVRWLDIHDADDGCLFHEGWSHNGSLTHAGLIEIRTERERRAAVFEAAINGRSSGAVDDADIDSVAEPVQWAEG